MVQYATSAELETYLQRTLGATTADLVLTIASATFSNEAGSWWSPQSVTYTQAGTRRRELVLPYDPVTAVAAVRINGTPITGYKLIKNTLYRPAGFGFSTPFALPDLLEVDLTHGYNAVTDDVKGAVLDMAAAVYESPDSGVISEQIDDYAVRRRAETDGVSLTPRAQAIAASYRVPAVA